MTRRVVARGTVSIDPGKAVEKMRAFQLLDPRQWAQEVVRVAVAGGANEIVVEQDADDVVISFDGRLLPVEELARIFDHLFGGADRRIRLLAIAVNTALGLAPKYLDLIVAGTRVRWTKDAIDAALAKGDALVPESVEPGVVVPGLPDGWMRVHLRDRLGLGVLADFVGGRQQEAERLRTGTARLRGTLRIGGEPPQAAPAGDDRLGRAEVTGLGRTRGEVVFPLGERERADVLTLVELGVDLDTIGLPCDGSMTPGVAWPLAAWIDAPELPTNVSRSRVDLEGEVGDGIRAALVDAAGRAVDAAIASLPALDPEQARRTSEALILLVGAALGDRWREHARGAPVLDPARRLPIPRETLDRILDTPLIPLATGGALSPRVAAQAGLATWNEASALEPELAEGGAPIAHAHELPRALDWLIQTSGATDAHERVADARQGRERRERWQQSPRRAPAVPPAPRELLRVRFADPPGGAGVHGELVIGVPAGTDTQLMVTGHVDGRPLATEWIARCALPLTVAVASPDLQPNALFDGLERDHGFGLALRTVYAAAAGAVRHTLGSPIAPPCVSVHQGAVLQSLAVALRGALHRGAIQVALGSVGELPPDVEGRLELLGTLAEAPAWETSTGTMLSTREVVALAQAPPHVLLHVHGIVLPRADRRPMLRLAEEDRELLRSLLPPARWIDATSWYQLSQHEMPPSPPFGRESIRLEHGPVRAVVWPSPVPSIAGSEPPALHALHAGRLLAKRALAPTLGGASIVAEDDSALPDPELPATPALRELVEHAEWELARTLMTAVQDVQRVAGVRGPLSPAASAFLLGAATRLRDAGAQRQGGLGTPLEGRALREVLLDLPLLGRISPDQRVVATSLREVMAQSGSQIPILHEVPSPPYDAEGFDAVIVPPALAEAVAAAVRRPLRNASEELQTRRLRWQRQGARARLARLPRAGLDDLPVAPESERLRVRTRLPAIGEVAIAPSTIGSPIVELIHDGRLLLQVPSPLDAPVHVRVALASEDMLTPELDGPTPSGRSAIQRLVEAGVTAMVRRMSQLCLEGEDPGDAGRAIVVEWVAAWHDGKSGAQRLDTSDLGRVPFFTTVRGTRISVEACRNAAGVVRYATTAFADWVSDPHAGQPEVEAIHVPALGVNRYRWVTCLGALGGSGAEDVGMELAAIQRRRRALLSRAEVVALPGVAPLPGLQARIETIWPALGVGEIRMLPDGAPLGLHAVLHRDGIANRNTTFAVPVAIALAVDSPLLRDADWLAQSFHALVDPALAAAHALCARALAEGEIPPQATRALRWHALTAEDLPDDVRMLPLFSDVAGASLSLAELEALPTPIRYSRGPVMRDPPPPDDERIVRLADHEVQLLAVRRTMVDRTLELARLSRFGAPPEEKRPAPRREDPFDAFATSALPLPGADWAPPPGAGSAQAVRLETERTPADAMPPREPTLGDLALERLRRWGIDADAVSAVLLVDFRRATVEFDPHSKIASVGKGHPIIARILTSSDPEAATLLAAAVLAEADRELEEITPADQERAMDLILAGLGGGGGG